MGNLEFYLRGVNNCWNALNCLMRKGTLKRIFNLLQ